MIDDVERGKPCPHWAHSRNANGESVARDPRTGACLACLAQVAEGRLHYSTASIHPAWRGRFLEFWSMVDVGGPSECWLWNGRPTEGKRPRPRFDMGTHGRHKGDRYVRPQMAAFIFTWGDIGQSRVSSACRNSRCCNPLHLRATEVPHAVGPQSMAEVEQLPMSGMIVKQRDLFLTACSQHSPRRFRRLQRQAYEGWIPSPAPMLPPGKGEEKGSPPLE